MLGQQLDGHVALEAIVEGAHDRRHAADAEALAQLVATGEDLAGHHGTVTPPTVVPPVPVSVPVVVPGGVAPVVPVDAVGVVPVPVPVVSVGAVSVPVVGVDVVSLVVVGWVGCVWLCV
jgi:hypothetical protein